jgi:hypothetical protein
MTEWFLRSLCPITASSRGTRELNRAPLEVIIVSCQLKVLEDFAPRRALGRHPPAGIRPPVDRHF